MSGALREIEAVATLLVGHSAAEAHLHPADAQALAQRLNRALDRLRRTGAVNVVDLAAIRRRRTLRAVT